METFDHIINWKLERGSHPFPGPDGGTCINEAAVLAAGFQYQAIQRAEDMPDCFSRPICSLAMRLNDQATDDERQRLLPFVTRLACGDTAEIERQRGAFIDALTYLGLTFESGLEALVGALAIGRQSEAVSIHEASTRLEFVRQNSVGPSFIPDAPASKKVTSWVVRMKHALSAE